VRNRKIHWGRPFQSAHSGWSVPPKKWGYLEVNLIISDHPLLHQVFGFTVTDSTGRRRAFFCESKVQRDSWVWYLSRVAHTQVPHWLPHSFLLA